MKHGANFKDRNDIARLAAEGLDAASISVKLQIAPACVENFMPKAEKAPAKPAKGKTETGE